MVSRRAVPNSRKGAHAPAGVQPAYRWGNLSSGSDNTYNLTLALRPAGSDPIKQIGSTTYAPDNSDTLAHPGSAAVGDLLLALVKGSGSPGTVPTGWTLGVHAPSFNFYFAYRFLQAGDPTSWNFPRFFTNSLARNSAMAAFRGVATSGTICDSASNTNNILHSDVYSPSVTTDVANCYLAVANEWSGLSLATVIRPQGPYVRAPAGIAYDFRDGAGGGRAFWVDNITE